MVTIDLHGITNMELVRGGTDKWYWSTDYIHGDLYEAEELFRMGHPVQSNRLYLIHYPDGTVYEPATMTKSASATNITTTMMRNAPADAEDIIMVITIIMLTRYFRV